MARGEECPVFCRDLWQPCGRSASASPTARDRLTFGVCRPGVGFRGVVAPWPPALFFPFNLTEAKALGDGSCYVGSQAPRRFVRWSWTSWFSGRSPSSWESEAPCLGHSSFPFLRVPPCRAGALPPVIAWGKNGRRGKGFRVPRVTGPQAPSTARLSVGFQMRPRFHFEC